MVFFPWRIGTSGRRLFQPFPHRCCRQQELSFLDLKLTKHFRFSFALASLLYMQGSTLLDIRLHHISMFLLCNSLGNKCIIPSCPFTLVNLARKAPETSKFSYDHNDAMVHVDQNCISASNYMSLYCVDICCFMFSFSIVPLLRFPLTSCPCLQQKRVNSQTIVRNTSTKLLRNCGRKCAQKKQKGRNPFFTSD